ncbi:unnamed protein product [Heligmosomoides polygyrus]|uniref:Neuroendocrine protein 7B2 n=1 Tax=Heligmosomoides polygyrus TaxID=6339 RepID=A0A183FR09_HELPZ|nr:unnamed protein product [Heligmosomoides polygyrus]
MISYLQTEAEVGGAAQQRIDPPQGSLSELALVMMLALLALLVANALAFDFGESAGDMALLPSGDFIDLISRDAESVPSPVAFGSKYITGGAGEGEQKLREEENFQQRQEVKSDNVLPAYCEPPNPCPIGFTAADGCLEEFENRYHASSIFRKCAATT